MRSLGAACWATGAFYSTNVPSQEDPWIQRISLLRDRFGHWEKRHEIQTKSKRNAARAGGIESPKGDKTARGWGNRKCLKYAQLEAGQAVRTQRGAVFELSLDGDNA
jgi:hypothetical protein